MDKKNLDELFREKFRTFREIPDEKVWAAIENSLDKKRKRRILPLWWQLGGVAAVLAIAFFSFYILNDSGDEIPTITNTEKTKTDSSEEDEAETDIEQNQDNEQGQKDVLHFPETNEDGVANGTKDADFKNTEQYPISDPDGPSGSENAFGSENSSGSGKTNAQKDALPIPEIIEEGLANSGKDVPNKKTEQYDELETEKDSFSNQLSNTKVAETKDTSLKDRNKKNSGNKSPEKNPLASNAAESEREDAEIDNVTRDNNTIRKKDKSNDIREGNRGAIAIVDTDIPQKTDTSKTDTKQKDHEGIAENQENPKIISEELDRAIAQNEQNDTDGDKADRNKKSISEALEEQNKEKGVSEESDKAIAQKDQTDKEGDKAEDNKKSIFEVLEEQDEEDRIAEEPSRRWSAGPNIAPVYFNAMGEGSPIDPGFSPNAKSGSTNMSYGLSIAYAVTKKLSVRSGIHKAEYGYDTNDVGFSPTLAASSSGRLQNIDQAGGAEILADSSPNLNLESSNDLAPEFSSLNSARDGTVAQQFGYLEIPLELDYALIDRRFGVNLVGGVSSLFLIDNSVTLSSGELTTDIGEARNLNDLNFSTNIGFGINYKFTPKVQLNIEPVFKYQLNTFSNVSGEFRPFSIGVYSGLNFKF